MFSFLFVFLQGIFGRGPGGNLSFFRGVRGLGFEIPVADRAFLNTWKKNLQGLRSWAWLPKFCRTLGVPYEVSLNAFYYAKPSTETSCRTPNVLAVSNKRFANKRFSQLNDERCCHVRERSPCECCNLPVCQALYFVGGKSAKRAPTSGWRALTEVPTSLITQLRNPPVSKLPARQYF